VYRLQRPVGNSEGCMEMMAGTEDEARKEIERFDEYRDFLLSFFLTPILSQRSGC
jgi:hypothetical protein